MDKYNERYLQIRKNVEFFFYGTYSLMNLSDNRMVAIININDSAQVMNEANI